MLNKLVVLLTMLMLGFATFSIAEIYQSPEHEEIANFPVWHNPTEMIDMRADNAKFYRLPDGQTRTIIFQDPIHYRDDFGRFQDIDIAIRPVKNGKYLYANLTNTLQSNFIGIRDNLNPIVSTSLDHAITMNWYSESVQNGNIVLTPKTPKSTLKDNWVTYNELYTGISERYNVDVRELKSELIVKEQVAYTGADFYIWQGRWTFSEPVYLESINGDILYSGSQTDQQFKIKTSADKVVAFVDPVVVFSEVDRNTTREVTPGTWQTFPRDEVRGIYRLQTFGTEVIWEILVPMSWLTSPGRQFPVVIDPTTWVPSETGETDGTMNDCVCCSQSTGNFGNYNNWFINFGTGIERAYMWFNNLTTLIPAGSIVNASQFTFWNQYNTISPSSYFSLYRVTATWTELTPGYNNQEPPFTTPALVNWNWITSGGQFGYVTVTAIIAPWVLGTYTNYGWECNPDIITLNTWPYPTQSEYTGTTNDPRVSVDWVPGLQITAPAAGACVTCGTNYNITWTYAGTATPVDVNYSTDNGNTWNLIGSTNATALSMSWNPVPYLGNTTFKVQITDGSNINVQSGTFTIGQWTGSTCDVCPCTQVTVAAPNTPAVWPVGNPGEVTWTYLGNVQYVNVYIDRNYPSGWTTLATNVSAAQGFYQFVVTGPASTNTYFQVANSSCPSTVYDNSNAPITIYPDPEITVTFPNGGETFGGLQGIDITWTSVNPFSNANILWSSDGGMNWEVIANNVPNTGTYPWTVPNVITLNGLVRVEDVMVPSLYYDISDNVFEIAAKSIMVTYPNGGETWYGYDPSHTITWLSFGGIDYVNIYYTLDGTTWVPLVLNYANSGSWTWYNIPNNISSTIARIRVENYDITGIADQSNNVFSIIPSSVTVNQPNGGENWYVGMIGPIRWTNVGNVGPNVQIRLYRNGGWSVLESSTPNDGVYDWFPITVPTASDCRIEVTESTYSLTDQSNANFNIRYLIQITYPNGGQNFYGGQNINVQWVSNGPFTNATVELSTNGGSTWTVLANSIPNVNYRYVQLPYVSTNQALIRVYNSAFPLAFDVSDNPFNINTATFFISQPNGGERITRNSYYVIEWFDFGTNATAVRLDWRPSPNNSWIPITSWAQNNGYYFWWVPNILTSSAQVRISSYSNSSIFDISDGFFSIVGSQSGWAVNMDFTGIKVQPNPVSKNFVMLYQIENKVDAPIEFSLYDLAGKVIHSQTVMPDLSADNTRALVNLDATSLNIPQGVYFAKAVQLDKQYVEKVMIVE